MQAVKRVYGIGCFQLEGPMPWLDKILQEFRCRCGFAEFLHMPNPRAPLLEEWLEVMAEAIKPPWEEVGLVAHSIGGAAALHFIRRHVRAPLGGLALVCSAPSFRNIKEGHLIKTFEFESHDMAGMWCSNVVMVNGRHDPYVPEADAMHLAKRLEADLVWTESGGHFGITDRRRETRDLPVYAKKTILNTFGYFPSGQGWDT